MGGTSSSRKGKKGERGLAETLTEVIGVQFRRVPHSGSLRVHLDAKFSDFTKRALSGDIMIDSEHQARFPFSVECKNLKKLNYLRMMLDDSRELKAFWQQVLDERPNEDTIPLLCIHTDRQPWIAFTTFDGAGHEWHTVRIKINGEYTYAGSLLAVAEAIKKAFFDDLNR
jgi:hypothetical protein